MPLVRICAAPMDGPLGSKFSEQGPPFPQIFLKHGWVWERLAKQAVKNGLVFHLNSS